MKTSKPSVRYQGISVPVTLIDAIKKHIANKSEYRSVSEFVKEAIREKIKQPKNDFSIEDLKKISESMAEYMDNINNTYKNLIDSFNKSGLNPDIIQKMLLENSLQKIIKKNKSKK